MHHLDGKHYKAEWDIVTVNPENPVDLSKAQPGSTVVYANGDTGVFEGTFDSFLPRSAQLYKSRSQKHGLVCHTRSGKYKSPNLDIKTVISCTTQELPTTSHQQPKVQLPTEGITATRPTIKDADSQQNVQVLTGEGWGIKRWELTKTLPWAHTPNYRPPTKEDLALQLSNNLENNATPSSHLLKLILNYLNE
jgi:hypothetical protein